MALPRRVEGALRVSLSNSEWAAPRRQGEAAPDLGFF